MKRLVLFPLLVLAGVIQAAPLNPDNVLVVAGAPFSDSAPPPQQNYVVEYTPGGVLVQTFPFNYGNRSYESIESLRDVAVDRYGNIFAFNGTGNPYLTKYSPSTGEFFHKPFLGWDILINWTAGGIATYQNFVFLGDQQTSYGIPNGLIRFDSTNGTFQRFAQGNDYTDVVIGGDGLLYALSGTIDIFDPVSMTKLRSVTLPSGVYATCIAADSSGRIFLTSGGWIYRLTSAGALDASVQLADSGLGDIDVDEIGRLIVGHESGYVILGDADFSGWGMFLAISDPNVYKWSLYVSFARSVPAPPNPSPTPPPTPTPSPAPTPTHDILVSFGGLTYNSSQNNAVNEFRPDGSFVRTIPFNYGASTTYPGYEVLRDIVVDADGAIAAFNGTENPYLTRYWPTGAVQNWTFTDWNVSNGFTFGALATFENFIFAPDMGTSAQPNANGIVRFDLQATSVRFATGYDFRDLNMGLDGNLYGLSDYRTIRVYDPTSMTFLREIQVPSEVDPHDDIQGLAADGIGRIFLVTWYGAVYRLNPAGDAVEKAVASGFKNLTDIDIDETGRIIMGQKDGWLVISDTNLDDFTFFEAKRDRYLTPESIFVGFAPLAPPATPTPTPTPTATPTPTPTPIPLPGAATPIISPSGGTFKKKVTIKMSDATAGATIYYTTDGSDPTTSSSIYPAGTAKKKSKGITLKGVGTYTVKAKAVAPGFSDSTIASATFTIR